MTHEDEERRQEEFNRKADKVAREVVEPGCLGCLTPALPVVALVLVCANYLVR